jgi:hypothetical protein
MNNGLDFEAAAACTDGWDAASGASPFSELYCFPNNSGSFATLAAPAAHRALY